MPPTVFSKSIDLKLIQLVKEHPVLYNPRHPKYTDSDTREVTWQKIGDSLSRPAVEFAAIQCQIQFGDFQEDKHKPGFIENLKEFLPETYVNGWHIEKKILKEYRKHQGLSQLEAKHLYTKTARGLPTYGVTFFLVKEKQKDKKKLVPRLLGINAESILRLDETSKEILQQWPLTHVKSYHASKGEIFTLNFGEYSEKEYSVKTRDAYRIRDILEDYIDLVRRRMLAQHHGAGEASYVTEDNVSCGQANVVQHMTSTAMKIVDHQLVGPSSIISVEQGSKAGHGAQIVTVQQIMVSNKGGHTQNAVKSEVGLRGDMSIPFTRRLNRLNSNSVKIVNLLTESSDTRMDDSRKFVDDMNADLPFVKEGVLQTISKQTSEEERRRLRDQMQELEELMASLTAHTAPPQGNASEAGDAAMRIADVTTQMYFSLDSTQKRRSKIISRSHASFVEDEHTQRILRKASFIVASAAAEAAASGAHALLDQEFAGEAPDARRSAELQASALDKLGELNAAIAHYIMAHSDPQNVDYDAAIISMNTINELLPEFCKDVHELASCKDPKTKQQLLADARSLSDVIKKIGSSVDKDGKENAQKAVKEYSEASGRLAFVFSRGRNQAKEVELRGLAEDVASQTARLLQTVQAAQDARAGAAGDAAGDAGADADAVRVDDAGVRTADAAQQLITQVQVTAGTVESARCRSALTAAAGALADAAQRLAAAARPAHPAHPSHPAHPGGMHDQTMELARALDRLKAAYSDLGEDEESEVFANAAHAQAQRRLQFVRTASGAGPWREVDRQLAQPLAGAPAPAAEAEAARARLPRRVAQLRAAIAGLLAATADLEHADYGAAELAVHTIEELMPQLVQDSKLAGAGEDPETRAAMLEHLRALCGASRAVACCAAADGDARQDRGEVIDKFINASGKLVFGISQASPNKRGKAHKILELTEQASQKTSELVSGSQVLAEELGVGKEALLQKGATCSAAAQALRTTGQVTAPSISEPRCQHALLSSVELLSSSCQELAAGWRQLEKPGAVGTLETKLADLDQTLISLRDVCAETDDFQEQTTNAETPGELEKLQFVRTLSGAREQIKKTQKALDRPIPPPQNSEKANAIRLRLSGRLDELNAAIAALHTATSSEQPDYKAAEEAMAEISKILPYVVQDTQSSCSNVEGSERAAMLDLLRELCEASRTVCERAPGTDGKGLSDAVQKLGGASGKLVYVVNPRASAKKESEIVSLAAAACGSASSLLAGVELVSGGAGAELGARGAALADAARRLLATAQLTAASISEPSCRAALLSSIDQLFAANQELAESWRPLLLDPGLREEASALEAPWGRLGDALEALRDACRVDSADFHEQTTNAETPGELEKLQFVRTLSGAREQIEKAQKALDRPIPPPQNNEKANAIRLRLSGRLDELNAAIAALHTATSSEQPDYKAAEEAMAEISKILPYVVQDTQSSCSNVEGSERAAMLDLLRELCEASRTVCERAPGTDGKGLSDAVQKLGGASGKLVYVVNPRASAKKESEIVSLAAAACGSASSLLAGVELVSGGAGAELGARGAALADAARRLLATAQLTAASISEPSCRAALLSSIEQLFAANQELAESWRPLLLDPGLRKEASALEAPWGRLEDALEALRDACRVDSADFQEQTTNAETPRELEKLQFVRTLSGAREQIKKTQKALDRPIPPPQNSEKANAIRLRLSGRLDELNAAIAALHTATSSEQPDYKAAEEAMAEISKILPYVVQDTQSSCSNAEGSERAAMLDLLRELCEASRTVCERAPGTDGKGLSDAVQKLGRASGKLVYVVNPRASAKKESEIVSLAAAACGSASSLLAGVELVSGGAGAELGARGAALADAARRLLATAQLTAASISEPSCRAALLSSIEQLFAANQELAESWRPLLLDPGLREEASALEAPWGRLEDSLEALRDACRVDSADFQEQTTNAETPGELEKLQFVRTLSGAREQIEKAQKALDRPIPPPQNSEKANAIRLRLSGRLDELNAAIAALHTATSSEQPDYKAAEEAMAEISKILPYVVQDTQSSCSNVEGSERAAMLDLLRELCEASRTVCERAPGTDGKGLSDAVQKLGGASGKLVYVVNLRASAKKESEIVSLAAAACGSASSLLAGVELVSGGAGAELGARGAALADAARRLLATAQLTAASISEPSCRAALLSSIEQLFAANQELAESWRPLLLDPGLREEASALEAPWGRLEDALEALRDACRVDSADFHEQTTNAETPGELEKLQFVRTLSGAREQIEKAQKALDRPIPPPQNSEKANAIRLRLSGRLDELNAAIAALHTATSSEQPDYKAAEEAMAEISKILPYVVQDTQSSCSNVEESERAAMLDLLRELCEASRTVCERAPGTDGKGLSDAVQKLGGASGKLVYVVNLRASAKKESEIVSLAAAACGSASSLLAGVELVSGGAGAELGARGAALADAARRLLATAQLTAASISEPSCRAALLSSIDQLFAANQELAESWRPLLLDPGLREEASALEASWGRLGDALEALRDACRVDSAGVPPPLPGAPPPGPACSIAEDERRRRQQFTRAVQHAAAAIAAAEGGLHQSLKSDNTALAISAGDCMVRQAHLQRNIALAAVQVASLVGANYADKIDYTAATKSTEALPELISHIVEDGKILSSTVDEESRRAFMQDMLGVCGASRRICDAAENDREKLNDAAIEFGDKSAKLLYVVSNDVDPTLEKEIITRAKAIGDSLAHISVLASAMAGGEVADPAGEGTDPAQVSDPSRAAAVRALCGAGAAAQDAAGKLVYTAKLVAPSIYEADCRRALSRAADHLGSELTAFSGAWGPFSGDPRHQGTVRDLRREADNLDRILAGLKSDLSEDRMGQIRRLVVEDTPLRQLTVRILEDAKKLSVSEEQPADVRRSYGEYSRRLSEALRALDRASTRRPHEPKHRRELEAAVQGLQATLLQTRPSRGDAERSNIVDLREFIDELSSEADKMAEAAGSLKVPGFADKKALEDINRHAQKMRKAAYTLTHHDGEGGFDSSYDDILNVDQFGEECNEIIAAIDKQIESIEDAKARNALLSKILPLNESCNMLRFATKSGISAARSVHLDAALDDLDDVEGRVIASVVRDQPAGDRVCRSAMADDFVRSRWSRLGAGLARAVCAGAGASPRAPLTAYVVGAAAAAAGDPQARNLVLKHLYKLVQQMRERTAVAGARAAHWLPPGGADDAARVDQILQEIQKQESMFLPEGVEVLRFLEEADLRKLLRPAPAKVFGDNKQQESKLLQLCTKLNSMSGTVAASVASPESLTRSAHATCDAALELAAAARGCGDAKDPVRSQHIDDAVQHMTFTTYGLLKCADQCCLEADRPGSRRRLKDACGELTAAIDKLMLAASSGSPLQQRCWSLALALQRSGPAAAAAPPAASARPYGQCCRDLAQHRETLNKLKSDEPMSRQEFARSLHEMNEAVCETAAITQQCAYLISVSEQDSDIAASGPVDVPRIQRSIECLQDSCMAVIGATNIYRAKEDTEDFQKRIDDFTRALDDAQLKVKGSGVKATLAQAKAGVVTSAVLFSDALGKGQDMDKVTPCAVSLLEEVNRAHSLIECCPLVPTAGTMSAETKARCDELSNHNQKLVSSAAALVKEVAAAEEAETMTWVTFGTRRTTLLDAYDALLNSIKLNGQRAGILEASPEEEAEEDVQSKTYLDTQVELAQKWLQATICKAQVKTNGHQAVRNVIDIATKMSEDLKGGEREEIRNVITETEELLALCAARYDNEKYSVLLDRVKELKKAVQRGVVSRVVQDFMEAEDPVEDLELLVDSEPDSQKRAFLLKRKIAELLAQLARVTRTARFVADAGGTRPDSAQILRCTEQAELLAPMLVQAAQEGTASADNKAVVDNYRDLLAKYAASIAKVRALCDRALDPMDFVQTAGEAMQRMREESSSHNDVQKGQRASEAIIKLANRSIEVGMSSLAVRRDPELRAMMLAAQRRVLAAAPPAGARASRLPDWRESTAEVLRTTGQVESYLGGEHIFSEEPRAQGTHHQIYIVARDLHESVREWSSRDNEIVAAARRVAVLMARLSEYMHSDKKQALLTTSKSIVSESHEVAVLARKLAHECTDQRIKTNLLQTCERIPTISAQLKMLTTVKSSTLGQQGTKEDTEAMDMLVNNAQSLMISIQEVVKAAAGATVKIMSQHGPRLRWVRKTYY